MAAHVDQARALSAAWPAVATRLADSFWPGPLTLVLAARHSVPVAVTSGTGTVAVRVPASALSRALCSEGPLVSTSANRSGQAPPLTCTAALAHVGTSAALALDAGPGGPTPSTIVDLTGDAPVLLRDGAVPFADVLRVLGLEST